MRVQVHLWDFQKASWFACVTSADQCLLQEQQLHDHFRTREPLLLVSLHGSQ